MSVAGLGIQEGAPVTDQKVRSERRRSASGDAPQASRGGRVRCAIYTRKSSEEGLDQEFNSLDAQREACEAYVRSQKHEGWQALPALYDDGGFSGGNMERPALKRLLADIAAGRIDVVVVYKVDRLTRSLADFAKIVEVFDANARLVRLGHPGVQHDHQHGPADAQRAAVLRPVRARGHRRAHPRQDRRLEEEGHVDGRPARARLRRQGAESSSSTRRKPKRSGRSSGAISTSARFAN